MSSPLNRQKAAARCRKRRKHMWVADSLVDVDQRRLCPRRRRRAAPETEEPFPAVNSRRLVNRSEISQRASETKGSIVTRCPTVCSARKRRDVRRSTGSVVATTHRRDEEQSTATRTPGGLPSPPAHIHATATSRRNSKRDVTANGSNGWRGGVRPATRREARRPSAACAAPPSHRQRGERVCPLLTRPCDGHLDGSAGRIC